MKKAYQKYSKTNIPWLRFMPDHWDDVKVKFLFKERVEKGFPDEPLLAATQTQGVVPKELYENRTVTAQKDFHLLKLVEVGDFVISLRSFQGGIEYAYYRGIISPAYTVMKPLPEVFGGYFKYLFKSKHFVDDLTTYVTGIREGQNIDYSAFRDSFQPLPPLPEQRQIAAFLDHKCALIDTFIQKKTRLIELLKEQKQAIINKAVTKGIDPNVRLKPSGIEWLGEIPEGWEVKKLSFLIILITSGSRGWAHYYSEEGPVFLRVGNLSKGQELSLSMGNLQRVNLPTAVEGSRTRVKKKDVLLAITGATIGSVGVIEKEIEEAYVNQHIALIRPNQVLIEANFLGYTFLSEFGQVQIKLKMYGGTKDGLGLDDVKSFYVVLPSKIEQKKIITIIETELGKIDQTMEQIKSEIFLLQEYKTTLIAEAVTGKIDVRGWRKPNK